MQHWATVSAPIYVAYAAQGRHTGRDMLTVRCFSCKAFGHIVRDCPKKFCNYCKKQGHIISACPICPERKQGTAYHASTAASSSVALPAASPVVPLPSPTTLAKTTTLTPEMVQQMILSAFTAFGLSGNHKVFSKPWYFDSGASNHMTNTIVPLSNIRNYDGNMKINTADGNSFPISAIGDLFSSLTNVFVSHDLSTNVISVGQLVDYNCNVHFSRSGCVVQDQVSGQMIAKGPKVGRLFPLHVSPSTFIPRFPLLSFACNVVGFGNKMWHRRLGHPNSDVLHTLFNSRLLGNKTCSSIDLSFDCTSCKLGKSKVLPFPHHASHASQCFELIHRMFGGLHLLFLMHITSTLLLSLMTLVALLGFTSSGLRVRFFQFFNAFLHSLRLNSLPASRSCTLILAANTCLMSFRFFFKANGSSLSVLVLRHHNKTVLLRGKITTFWMS